MMMMMIKNVRKNETQLIDNQFRTSS